VLEAVDGLLEKPLTLSCPEAARLVLFDPELLPGYRRPDGDRGYGRLLALPIRRVTRVGARSDFSGISASSFFC